jgi:DNA-binding transcriptional ArsR family regulator
VVDLEHIDELSSVFGALADPTRRAILQRLAAGDAKVAELAAPFHITQPAVSKHLKVLEAAGLISRSRSATSRLSHLEAAPMRAANEYIERYRRFWAGSFDRLDSALADHRSETAPIASDE